MEVFPPTVVGALKPSITFRSLSSLQLAPQFAPAHSPVCSSSLPSSLQLAPQFAPACSSLLPSLLQLAPQCAPAHSPVHSSSLPPSPIAPYTPTGGGDPNTYMAIWSEMEQAGSELEQTGSSDWAGSKLEWAGSWEWAGASWFWARGGDLQRSFTAMWMDIRWGFYFQVVGTHKQNMS